MLSVWLEFAISAPPLQSGQMAGATSPAHPQSAPMETDDLSKAQDSVGNGS
jgi:hypothetical protein